MQDLTKRIIGKYYEQLAGCKFSNLDKLYQFLQIHKLLKFIQEKIKETEVVVKNLPQKI